MKKAIIVQCIVLVLVILAGAMLKQDLASNFRVVHRSLGMLAGLVGFITLVMAFVKSQSTAAKTLLGLAFILIGSAGYAGNAIATTTNYTFTFNQMALSAVAALIASILALRSVKE